MDLMEPTGPELIIGLLLLIPGMLAIYIPRIQLKKSEAHMASDIIRLKPDLKWIIWGFPLAFFVWTLILVGILFLLMTQTGGSEFFLYMGHFTAASGLFYGGFTLATGVMVLPKRRTFPMWCVVGDRAYSAGEVQVFVSIIAIVFNSVIIYMFAP